MRPHAFLQLTLSLDFNKILFFNQYFITTKNYTGEISYLHFNFRAILHICGVLIMKFHQHLSDFFK